MDLEVLAAHQGEFPDEVALGIEHVDVTPALQKT
jgi:hypothetical protein